MDKLVSPVLETPFFVARRYREKKRFQRLVGKFDCQSFVPGCREVARYFLDLRERPVRQDDGRSIGCQRVSHSFAQSLTRTRDERNLPIYQTHVVSFF